LDDPPQVHAGILTPRAWLHAVDKANGLALDALPLPVQNPWNRRIRPADIAFLTKDRAAIVTFDGDVWIAEGLSSELSKTVRWRRYASGLNEPLSIAEVKGVLQVYSRNGLVRLYDRKGTGEADWYENFSDDWTQSVGSRAFALDMAVDKDGSTVVSQGGIARTTPCAGAITRISADGRNAQILSERAREPYVTLHPTKGWLTSTDQQGNFIPSSVCYLVRKGDSFGFGEEHPQKLTPPPRVDPPHAGQLQRLASLAGLSPHGTACRGLAPPFLWPRSTSADLSRP
jgi:glucose/arabinose dehydrogenase